eukprot:6435982-Prymnesium_polylepis.1
MLPPLDPLCAVNQEMSRLGPLLLPAPAIQRTADYSAVSCHLYPDLAKTMNPASGSYLPISPDSGTAAIHHVAFAITRYDFDSSVTSQTAFDPDDPQSLCDLGLITDIRKVLLIPNGHMEPAAELQPAWAGVFTVKAISPMKVDTSGARFQMLVRVLEIHQFDIDWSLNVQLRKAAETPVSIRADDGSVVWVASLPRN